ncbi:MAG: type 1 glutamine amidotransferase [Deltaproteobacteria bacterium]|jgi:GMP synthase-like glutamine amidotransferase|nr:type 1 glutamine amidotransferase [Deltaproteobacteria bacterium]
MMKRILFIDNSVDDIYHPLDHFKGIFYLPYDVVHASSEVFPDDLSKYSHIVLSGSFASTLKNYSWQVRERKFIRKAADQGKVMMGVCHGHQLMGQAFFGPDAVGTRDHAEIGWPDIEVLEDDPLFGKSNTFVNAFSYHYDEVRKVDTGMADVIARSKECNVLAFRMKNRPVWGIQPHFELGYLQALALMDQIMGPGNPVKKSFITDVAKHPKDSGWIFPLFRSFQETDPLG